MRSISKTAAGLACLTLLRGVSAAGTVEARLLGGVCYDFAGATQSMTTGNTYVGSVDLRPAGTGTYIDDLERGFTYIPESQRFMLPWGTVSLKQQLNSTCPR